VPPAAGKRPGHNGAVPPGPGARPGVPGAPVLTVVSGNPSAEEVAALVAVLATRSGPASEPAVAGRLRYEWSSRSRLMRPPLPRGQGGWRASALPR